MFRVARLVVGGPRFASHGRCGFVRWKGAQAQPNVNSQVNDREVWRLRGVWAVCVNAGSDAWVCRSGR